MSLNVNVVFEVRTTGSDSNGGGYRTGGAGIDYSQQDSAQWSGTDLVIDSVDNTKVSSASHSFVINDINNCINISSGGGFTAGVYEILAVSSGVATLDRACGTVSSTSGIWAVGGALASWAFAANVATVAGQTIWIKSGTYNVTNGAVNVSGGIVQPSVALHWEGYQTTRGDMGTPPLLFNSSGQTGKVFFQNSGNQSSRIINLAVDANNAGGSCEGFNVGNFGFCLQCRAYNCTYVGIGAEQETNVIGCYAENCSGGFYHAFIGRFLNCVAKNSTNWGFQMDGSAELVNCIAYGSGQDGFINQNRAQLINCVSYGNARDGFNNNGGGDRYSYVNCIAEGNGHLGLSNNSTHIWMIDCAFYNNTAGAVAGTTPEVNINQINGTGTFFVSAPTDFRLNSGAGALLLGAGYPQNFIVNGTVNRPNIGAVQSAVSSGGGSGSSASSYPFSGA